MSGYIGPYYMIDDRVSKTTTWGVTDINRLGGAINYLQSEAAKYGLTFASQAKDDYQVNDFILLDDWLTNTWDPLLDTCATIGFGNVAELGTWNYETALDVSLANLMERALLLTWDLLRGYSPMFTGAAFTGNFIG